MNDSRSMPMGSALEGELAALIIEFCNIENIAPGDVPEDVPLIGPESPFDLDSLDAVEIIVAVQKRYQVRLGADAESREALTSLKALASFVRRRLDGD